MNEGMQMEVQCVDTGFPYTAAESFMDFFHGLTTHLPVSYAHAASVLHQVVFSLLVKLFVEHQIFREEFVVLV